MTYDLVIKGGTLVDGTGRPAFDGDVAIAGGVIAEIGRVTGPSRRTVDADGLIVAPGFIDMHSHTDYTLPVDSRAESKIRQGVTTEVIGNCGLSLAPLANDLAANHIGRSIHSYDPSIKLRWRTYAQAMDALERRGMLVNFVPLVGHGTIRTSVMGYATGPAGAEQIAAMQALVRESMADGAWGLSTGLPYAPGLYSDTEELVSLARVAAAAGGIYCSHIRSEGRHLPDAVREATRIAEEAGIPVNISHVKAMGRPHWGQAANVLSIIGEARSRGLSVTADVYPYEASATSLDSFLPGWAMADGALAARLGEPSCCRRMAREMEMGLGATNDISWSDITVAYHQEGRYIGQTVSQVAQSEHISPPAAMVSLLQSDIMGRVVFRSIDEGDMIAFLRCPWVMIGSDGRALSTSGPLAVGKPHPRYFGTFPRVLGRYVREKKVLGLEEAIRKMTDLPAQTIGLKDRGRLKAGQAADLVVFDPARIRDTATYAEPLSYPHGIHFVIVNGGLLLEDGELYPLSPGRILRKKVN